MDLRDAAALLRRRWRVVLLAVSLGLGLAAASVLSTVPQYTATTTLFVAAQVGGEEDISSAYAGGLFTRERVKSYAVAVSSPEVAALVVQELRLQRTPEDLAGSVSAGAPPETVLLDVSVTDPDPVQAQRLADSYGRQFARFVEQVERPQDGGPSPVKLSVIRKAGLPAVPSSPRTRLDLLLGLLLGAAAGLVGAVVRDVTDTRVKTPKQAAEIVGAPLLGVIPLDPDVVRQPLLVHAGPGVPRAEALRELRTNLGFVAVGHGLRSVVVTSSVPEEGKSLSSCNLAITLASAGHDVVLVEADLRRPRVAEYMGLEGGVGLTDVLVGDVPLHDALQPWGGISLRVLASGALPPNPSELLGSPSMSALLAELEAEGAVVVLDAPPLLPVTDAAVLASRTTGALLLVRADHVTREQLGRSRDVLQAAGATVLGTVYNMAEQSRSDPYAYGGGYYRREPTATPLGRHAVASAAVTRQPAP